MNIRIECLPSTRIYTPGYDSGSFPVIATTNGSDVVIVYRAGAGHMGITGRLEAVRSEDGECWSKPVIVADSEQDDRNPAVGVTRNGIVIVAYLINGSYRGKQEYDPSLKRLHTCITRSRDNGRTWETPERINLVDFDGLSPYGQMVTLPDGSLLMPIYGNKNWRRETSPASSSYLLCSRDEGRTWEEYSLVQKKTNEAAYVLCSDGGMLAALRFEGENDESPLVTITSADSGKTWCVPSKATEPHEHPACLTMLSNGYVLLCYGFRGQPYGVRGLISKDCGRSWLRDKTIIFEDGAPNWDCGYPSTIRLNDGRLVTAWYSTSGKEADIWSCCGTKCTVLAYREDELLTALER